MAYQIEGQLLEVCSCEVLCPCWIGEMPDGGTCDGVVAYHIEKGTVNGVDVSGHTFALAGFIPGNALDGNWKVVLFVDDGASAAQRDAILNAFTGELGGPLADVASLVGEVVAVEQTPISVRVVEGKGTLKIGVSRGCGDDAVRRSNRRGHHVARDRVHDDPRLAGVCLQGIALQAQQRYVRNQGRGSSGSQRNPGNVPVRGVTNRQPVATTEGDSSHVSVQSTNRAEPGSVSGRHVRNHNVGVAESLDAGTLAA